MTDSGAIPRVARIAEVIERMRAIKDALPPTDGVVAFTTLYLAVTEEVEHEAAASQYEDEPFVRWLDVVFANLYFEALDAAAGKRPVPRAWAPLVRARDDRRILPLQFALAGMNAHINRDLPVALVRTCEARGVDLASARAQRRDFMRINARLAATEEKVKRTFATGLVGDVDVLLGRLDDVAAMWNVARAREAAWTNAELLWSLRGLPELRARFLTTLERMVGFAGRGLLRPLV